MSLAALEAVPVASYCRHPLAGCNRGLPDCTPLCSLVATCPDALHLPPAVAVDYARLLCRHTWNTLADTSVDT